MRNGVERRIAVSLLGVPTANENGNFNAEPTAFAVDIGGTIVDISDGDDPRAQIRLSLSGDDLLALVAGELNFAGAWASGRVSVKAGVTDLLKLRKLL